MGAARWPVMAAQVQRAQEKKLWRQLNIFLPRLKKIHDGTSSWEHRGNGQMENLKAINDKMKHYSLQKAEKIAALLTLNEVIA